MLYRPHFCCHCGEKIIRAKWTPLTSRRFCDFCAVEQKQHDLLPRAAAVVLLIFGAAGITSYLGSGNALHKPPANEVSSRTESVKGSSPKPENSASLINGRANAQPVTTASPVAPAKSEQLPEKRDTSTESVHYCGAITKKGTACTRRVKSPGRCWQHLGQSSAMAMEK